MVDYNDPSMYLLVQPKNLFWLGSHLEVQVYLKYEIERTIAPVVKANTTPYGTYLIFYNWVVHLQEADF